MKKVLLMIAAGLVMTSSAFATGPAAGCPLKNFGNGVGRFDKKSIFQKEAQQQEPQRQEPSRNINTDR